MKSRVLASAAALTCLSVSSPSPAATVQYQFTGTVNNSYLARPLLGLGNDDPIAFSATVNIDPDTFVQNGLGNVRTTHVYGSFVLAGRSFVSDYGEDSIFFGYQDGKAVYSPAVSILGLSTTLSDGSGLGLAFSIYNASFSRPAVFIGQSQGDVLGTQLYAQLQAYDRSSNNNATSYDTGDVKLSYVGLAPSSAVPEPATWSLLVVGCGFVGFAMRRSQTATAGHQAT